MGIPCLILIHFIVQVLMISYYILGYHLLILLQKMQRNTEEVLHHQENQNLQEKSRQSGECRPMEVEYSTNDKSIPESLRLILSNNSPPPKRKKTSISNKAKSVCNGVSKILN